MKYLKRSPIARSRIVDERPKKSPTDDHLLCYREVWKGEHWGDRVALQVAAKAQRASVEPEEVIRYEQYNAKHGAKYCKAGQEEDTAMDEDEW